jgi:hypothetical protein
MAQAQAQAQGKRLMSAVACINAHTFIETLKDWESRVPVDCGEPWAWPIIEAAVEKGSHKSATMDK